MFSKKVHWYQRHVALHLGNVSGDAGIRDEDYKRNVSKQLIVYTLLEATFSVTMKHVCITYDM